MYVCANSWHILAQSANECEYEYEYEYDVLRWVSTEFNAAQWGYKVLLLVFCCLSEALQ